MVLDYRPTTISLNNSVHGNPSMLNGGYGRQLNCKVNRLTEIYLVRGSGGLVRQDSYCPARMLFSRPGVGLRLKLKQDLSLEPTT